MRAIKSDPSLYLETMTMFVHLSITASHVVRANFGVPGASERPIGEELVDTCLRLVDRLESVAETERSAELLAFLREVGGEMKVRAANRELTAGQLLAWLTDSAEA
ncbi:hypothetical protein AAHZ94_05230 [Streptomyces sp. HSW2009]|uniref:hypothetical protein n=1 Tax=Streptomyces sp. HSW2009 TaxID=3142890 RepID=UPI0032EB482A